MLESGPDPLSAPPLDVVEPPPSIVRVTADRRRLDAWALALVSRGMSPVGRYLEGQFELHVPPGQLAAARRELDAYDDEEQETQVARRADAALDREPPATRHAPLGAVLMGALLLAFFAVTGPRAGGSAWFEAGAANAERVLHGEWWRAVTALTLHADTGHVLSNVGIGAFVVGAVMRSEGVGFGAALVLASGTLGNLINAWAHQSLHSSVGFSTAVFGAIGILGGLAYVQGQRRRRKVRPAWTALAGTVALLALLGTGGERTDLFAHLFGALAGVGLGLVVAWRNVRPVSALGQWAAGLGTLAFVAAAWARAFA